MSRRALSVLVHVDDIADCAVGQISIGGDDGSTDFSRDGGDDSGDGGQLRPLWSDFVRNDCGSSCRVSVDLCNFGPREFTL